MNTRYDATAYGEQVKDLLPRLMTIEDGMTLEAGGMRHSTFVLEARDGIPLKRALMRVESDLLLEDADLVGHQDSIIRTDGQRRGDALIRLIQTISRSPEH
jgi:hypothetical protein